MKVRAVIRSAETREVAAEGEAYQEAREAAEAAVPEGWTTIALHVDRD